MQFTLGMPFLGILGKYYRNRKGLKLSNSNFVLNIVILKATEVIDFLFFHSSWLLGYLAAITLRAAAAECDVDLTRMLVVSHCFNIA